MFIISLKNSQDEIFFNYASKCERPSNWTILAHICFMSVHCVNQVEDQMFLVPINRLELVKKPNGILEYFFPSEAVNTLKIC